MGNKIVILTVLYLSIFLVILFPTASIAQAFIFASLGDAQLQSTNLKNTAIQIMDSIQIL
jgi:hypothetical protein